MVALADAVLWLDAGRYSGSGSWLNLGTGGSALDAALPGGAANPKFLAHTGENYMYVPLVGSVNLISVPHAANLDASAALEIIVRVRADDYTAGNYQVLVSKRNGTGTLGYGLFVDPSGQLFLSIGDGVNHSAVSVGAGLVDATTYWLRATWDDTLNVATFYKAADQATIPTAWTTINAPALVSTGITSNPAPLVMGVENTAFPFGGNLHRVIVRTTIGGADVLDVDFAQTSAQTSFVCRTGQTVTITRATSNRKLVQVVRPTWLFGLDDYLTIPDNALLDFALTDSFTVIAFLREWATPITGGRIIEKPGAPGWYFIQNSTTQGVRFIVADAALSADVNSPISTSGALRTFAGVRDVAADRATAYLDGVAGTPQTDPTTGTSANGVAATIGGQTSFADMELFGIAVFRSALTAAELVAISAAFTAQGTQPVGTKLETRYPAGRRLTTVAS